VLSLAQIAQNTKQRVVPGLDPGIHARRRPLRSEAMAWMAGTSKDKPGHDGI